MADDSKVYTAEEVRDLLPPATTGNEAEYRNSALAAFGLSPDTNLTNEQQGQYGHDFDAPRSENQPGTTQGAQGVGVNGNGGEDQTVSAGADNTTDSVDQGPADFTEKEVSDTDTGSEA